MSSLDAVRARVRFGVTYDTIDMHQVNRKSIFQSFVSLSTFDQFFTTDFQAGIKSIEPLNGRVGGLHRHSPDSPVEHCLRRLREAGLPSDHQHDVQLPTTWATEIFECCHCSNVK
jgi:hypothetical protein